MPVVNVNLLVDEKTYAGVKAGVLELCGMAKNVDNKRVAKHIPAVADAAKEGAVKAIDFIREHKKGAIVIGEYSCAAEPPVRGGVSHLSRRNEPL